MAGNVDLQHHHFPSSGGAFPFHTRLDPTTYIGGSRLIAHNARVAQDQQVYEKAFNASHEQHQALLAEHAAVVDEIHNKHNRLAAYHYYRQETANLDLEQLVFSPYLCVALLDKGTVNIDGTVTFHFRDGSTQVVAIKADIGQAPGCD